jgi:SpoVK/Ycf46/Vps4 family AAA+-type ATPase
VLEDGYRACRQRALLKLGPLVQRVTPASSWSDLVLPGDKEEQLRDICERVRRHEQVHELWGFSRKSARGRGVSALFHGPPGTGKTIAAEVVAGDLGLELFKVELSGVVSKYIGETEKNLELVFEHARAANAVLFFDEADALFGKRTEVSDARDRYANLETSYLLQKMDEYEGIVVMASNFRDNLDDAFTRRLQYVLEFPFPDAAHRTVIWRKHFPVAAPLEADLDFERLGKMFPLAGGHIRNISLQAAFLAAARTSGIGMRHVLAAARREFEKIGKLWEEPGPAPAAGRT